MLIGFFALFPNKAGSFEHFNSPVAVPTYIPLS